MSDVRKTINGTIAGETGRYFPDSLADAILAALEENGMVVVPKEAFPFGTFDHMLSELAKRQEPLGAEFDAAIFENVEELYETDVARPAGFLSTMTDAQKQQALEYRGEDTHGDAARPAGTVKEG